MSSTGTTYMRSDQTPNSGVLGFTYRQRFSMLLLNAFPLWTVATPHTVKPPSYTSKAAKPSNDTTSITYRPRSTAIPTNRPKRPRLTATSPFDCRPYAGRETITMSVSAQHSYPVPSTAPPLRPASAPGKPPADRSFPAKTKEESDA